MTHKSSLENIFPDDEAIVQKKLSCKYSVYPYTVYILSASDQLHPCNSVYPTLDGNISSKPIPNIKYFERSEIAIKFPAIWEVAQLSSSFCLEVIPKNINFLHFWIIITNKTFMLLLLLLLSLLSILLLLLLLSSLSLWLSLLCRRRCVWGGALLDHKFHQTVRQEEKRRKRNSW